MNSIVLSEETKQERADRFAAWKSNPLAFDALLEDISGGMSMRAWVAHQGFAYTSVVRWIEEDSQRLEQYARAREDRADVLFDEIVSIADEESTTIKNVGEEEVNVVFDATAVARNRLRVDARKWAASKLAPKKYGDKLAIGGAEDMPGIKLDGLDHKSLTEIQDAIRFVAASRGAVSGGSQGA